MLTQKDQGREDAYRHDLRGYQTGFIVAAILTTIPFVLVASRMSSTYAALWVVGGLGLLQIVVHLRYFLHVDLSPERREELCLMLFSVALVAVMIAGMLWLLFNLDTRMM